MKDFAVILFQVVIFLPLIVGLIYLSLRFGGSKLQSIQNGRMIKIMERVALSKENSLVVAKIGEKGYVISSTNGRIEILIELNDEELIKLESAKSVPQYATLKEMYQKLNNKRKSEHEEKI
jgi:flagellar biosynthetic protein FliO